MSSHVDDALEWLGRAEQAREVAGLLSDPGAKEAVLQLAAHYERLARAAVDRAERRNLKRLARRGDLSVPCDKDGAVSRARGDNRNLTVQRYRCGLE
jgi:hypothetical protein